MLTLCTVLIIIGEAYSKCRDDLLRVCHLINVPLLWIMINLLLTGFREVQWWKT